MKQARQELTTKLNAISGIIKQCALQVFKVQDPTLMQETTLAAITHESLCDLLERDGETKQVITLINDFGKAVVQLYDNIVSAAPASSLDALIPETTELFKQNKSSLPN